MGDSKEHLKMCKAVGKACLVMDETGDRLFNTAVFSGNDFYEVTIERKSID